MFFVPENLWNKNNQIPPPQKFNKIPPPKQNNKHGVFVIESIKSRGFFPQEKLQKSLQARFLGGEGAHGDGEW